MGVVLAGERSSALLKAGSPPRGNLSTRRGVGGGTYVLGSIPIPTGASLHADPQERK